MCLYPKFILNRKYLPNIKNNGTPPPITDERTRYVPVGCGKCMECRKQKSRNWLVRLHEEIRVNKGGKFATFTFTDSSLNELDSEIDSIYTAYERDNKIAKLAVRRFLERWRKTYNKSLKHWLVTELGQNNTERLHLHGIIWTNEPIDEVRKHWKYGNFNKLDKDWSTNYCTEQTVNYIIKYVNKTDEKHKYYVPVVLTSPGIGKNYLNRIDSKNNIYKGENTNELYTTRNGFKMNLPIYYRNKLYTDEQKQDLWINLLNKNLRYVNGIRIDVSQNEDDYFKVLAEQRQINNNLKYGDDSKDYDRLRYEKQLRNLKRLQRIEKERGKPPKPPKKRTGRTPKPPSRGIPPDPRGIDPL